MSPAAPPPPLMRVPPPLLFAGTFLLGWLLQRFVWPAGSAVALGWTRITGMVLVAIGVLVSASAVALFARARTTLVPHGEAAHLIVTGPYRFTRNPMYVGLASQFVGAALWSRTWLSLPLVLLPLLVLDRVVIPFEERQLREHFGAEFDAMGARVRRWL